MDINYEGIIITSVIAYTLAFYFKNLSNLIEKRGWLFFYFIHLPVFIGFCISTDGLINENDNVLTMVFCGIFLLRFLRKEHV